MAPTEKPAEHQEKDVPIINQAPTDPAEAIRIAINDGRIDDVIALLGSGMYIDLVDRDGKTPLFLAAEKGIPSLLHCS